MSRKTQLDEGVKTRINLTLIGEPAQILLELKRRGLAVSNHDAVVQALLALQERILSYDIRKAELKKFQEVEG